MREVSAGGELHALDAIAPEQLPNVEHDGALRPEQAADGPTIADRVDGFRPQLRLYRCSVKSRVETMRL